MALISVLSGFLSGWQPSFSALVFLLITALPVYHLVILPVYYSTKSHLWNLPGPTITRITPHFITLLDSLNLRSITIHNWHLKYGPVVRVAPNEVSFTSPTAIKDIYQDPTMEIDTRLYRLFTHFGANNAFTSRTRTDHGWRRKGIAAAVSWSKALEREVQDMSIGTVVNRYMKIIEENGMKPFSMKGGSGKSLVDVYLINVWYATDVVTGFIFGKNHGTRTLCFNKDE